MQKPHLYQPLLTKQLKTKKKLGHSWIERDKQIKFVSPSIATLVNGVAEILFKEFTMTPNKWITKVYKVFILFNLMVYMFRDPNQCRPEEGGRKVLQSS